MSAGVSLCRVMTCERVRLLEQFKKKNELGTNRVLSRIAGEVSDEKCLEVAGLDGPSKKVK